MRPPGGRSVDFSRTGYVRCCMGIRPPIEDETVDRLNEKLESVMRVDPAEVGTDKKLNVLLDELEKTERELRTAQKRADNSQQGLR